MRDPKKFTRLAISMLKTVGIIVFLNTILYLIQRSLGVSQLIFLFACSQYFLLMFAINISEIYGSDPISKEIKELDEIKEKAKPKVD